MSVKRTAVPKTDAGPALESAGPTCDAIDHQLQPLVLPQPSQT